VFENITTRDSDLTKISASDITETEVSLEDLIDSLPRYCMILGIYSLVGY
jgi:hypothetical protein